MMTSDTSCCQPCLAVAGLMLVASCCLRPPMSGAAWVLMHTRRLSQRPSWHVHASTCTIRESMHTATPVWLQGIQQPQHRQSLQHVPSQLKLSFTAADTVSGGGRHELCNIYYIHCTGLVLLSYAAATALALALANCAQPAANPAVLSASTSWQALATLLAHSQLLASNWQPY
jgi:hypothetical protein